MVHPRGAGHNPSSACALTYRSEPDTIHYQKEFAMLADPQTITVSGSAKTLNRTGSTNSGAEYASSDRAHQLSLVHTYGKRSRHQLRFKVDSLVANPLVSGQNINQSMSVLMTDRKSVV